MWSLEFHGKSSQRIFSGFFFAIIFFPHFSIPFSINLVHVSISIFESSHDSSSYRIIQIPFLLITSKILSILQCHSPVSLPQWNAQSRRTHCCPLLLHQHLIPISSVFTYVFWHMSLWHSICLFIAWHIYFYLPHKTMSSIVFISLASSKKLYSKWLFINWAKGYPLRVPNTGLSRSKLTFLAMKF